MSTNREEIIKVHAIIYDKSSFNSSTRKKQGRIHGNLVADGWAGAVMLKSLGIQKCDGRTDLPTDTARCRVACPRLKIVCLSHVTMHHGIYEALILGIGSLWIFVSVDNKTDCIWAGIGRVMHKTRPKTTCMWAGAVMNKAGYMAGQSRIVGQGQ